MGPSRMLAYLCSGLCMCASNSSAEAARKSHSLQPRCPSSRLPLVSSPDLRRSSAGDATFRPSELTRERQLSTAYQMATFRSATGSLTAVLD